MNRKNPAIIGQIKIKLRQGRRKNREYIKRLIKGHKFNNLRKVNWIESQGLRKTILIAGNRTLILNMMNSYVLVIDSLINIVIEPSKIQLHLLYKLPNNFLKG